MTLTICYLLKTNLRNIGDVQTQKVFIYLFEEAQLLSLYDVQSSSFLCVDRQGASLQSQPPCPELDWSSCLASSFVRCYVMLKDRSRAGTGHFRTACVLRCLFCRVKVYRRGALQARVFCSQLIRIWIRTPPPFNQHNAGLGIKYVGFSYMKQMNLRLDICLCTCNYVHRFRYYTSVIIYHHQHRCQCLPKATNHSFRQTSPKQIICITFFPFSGNFD